MEGTDFGNIIDRVLAISPLFIVKVVVLVLLLMYVVFSGVVVRQIEFMTRVLKEENSGVLRIFALLHFILAIFVFLLAVVIL